MTRREFGTLALAAASAAGQTQPAVTRYVRFRGRSTTAYGILKGEVIREIRGDLFGAYKITKATHRLKDVKLLCPCEPPKILAVGFNYMLEIGKRKPPERPEIFFKPVSALQSPGDPIVWPEGATKVFYEGEMAAVIGKQARRVSPEQAREVIFGVTCGNDVSEREWQEGKNKDLQWWRGKGCDTFAPLGPVLVRGLDFGKLHIETRLNGKVVQSASTAQMVFDTPAIVSWISQYMTLVPGDVIYTGTPGTTGPMKPGDTVEIELEGVGVLRNPVAAT